MLPWGKTGNERRRAAPTELWENEEPHFLNRNADQSLSYLKIVFLGRRMGLENFKFLIYSNRKTIDNV